MQETVLALTEIAADNSKELSVKWINLFLCIPTKDDEEIELERV